MTKVVLASTDIQNNDRAFPVTAVACYEYDCHVTKSGKSRSLNFGLCLTELIVPRSGRLINIMNYLINICTHDTDSSVCAPYVFISSYAQAQNKTLK